MIPGRIITGTDIGVNFYNNTTETATITVSSGRTKFLFCGLRSISCAVIISAGMINNCHTIKVCIVTIKIGPN